jgi:hypothetical protein
MRLDHHWRCMIVYSAPQRVTLVCGVWASSHDRHEGARYRGALAGAWECVVDLFSV